LSLRFGVWAIGFRGYSSRFEIQGLGNMVQGREFWVLGLRFKVWVGFREHIFLYHRGIQGLGCRISVSGNRDSGSGNGISGLGWRVCRPGARGAGSSLRQRYPPRARHLKDRVYDLGSSV